MYISERRSEHWTKKKKAGKESIKVVKAKYCIRAKGRLVFWTKAKYASGYNVEVYRLETVNDFKGEAIAHHHHVRGKIEMHAPSLRCVYHGRTETVRTAWEMGGAEMRGSNAAGAAEGCVSRRPNLLVNGDTARNEHLTRIYSTESRRHP